MVDVIDPTYFTYSNLMLKLSKLTLEELVVLYVIAKCFKGKINLDNPDEVAKLNCLLFLISHAELDDKGNIIGLRTSPRLNYDFVVGDFEILLKGD